MLKLEIPMFLTRPWSTSYDISLRPDSIAKETYLLHLLPCRGDILRELNIEHLLAGLALDGVLLGRKNALGSVNLEVDLKHQQSDNVTSWENYSRSSA
jgi:hypothetical protein